jgi:hypothetical protein
MELRQKIRTLRKWNKKYQEREALSWQMHDAISCGFGNEYLQAAIDEKRFGVINKLDLTYEEIEKIMQDYIKIEGEHLTEEQSMMGQIPDAYYELMNFHQAFESDPMGEYHGRNY